MWSRSPKPWYEGAVLTVLLSALLGLFTSVSDAEADALRSTAPDDLKTLDAAREHLTAARVAAVVTGMDADLLLSIAFHESRYDYRVRTIEPGRKISCGVMTPEPFHPTQALGACQLATGSPLAGYVAGARHIRGWLDAAHGNMHVAIIGYAGGYVGIRFCADPANARDYRCGTPYVFQYRAMMIRDAIRKATRPIPILI